MNTTSLLAAPVKPAAVKLSTTASVKIISIWSKCDEVPSRSQNFVYEVQVPASLNENDMLEAAFMATNIDSRPFGRQACSTSSGDIMVVNGNHYLVEGVGFHILTAEESEKAQKLTSRDTSFGYHFLKANNLI